MKKRKFNILLNIATLCLCITAIAFGVYSAKTASLNVSGTIGFNAHNCSVSVATTITGVATQDFGDKTTITKEAIAIDSTTSYTNTLALGDLFFTDKDTVNDQAAPIKMQFAISNKSPFAIKASVTLPTSNDVTILADKDSIKIDAGSNTAPTVGYITVTFKINNPDSDITKLDFSTNTFKFDFTKFDTKKSDITVNYDSEGKLSNYYIEYGTNKVTGDTKLKWYIIGTYGSDGQIQKLTPASDLTTVTENSTYKMKDTITYAFMSDYILPSDTSLSSVPFNNNVIINNLSITAVSNEYTDVIGCDYSISTLRAYLNGKSIYTKSKSESLTKDGVNYYKYTPDISSSMVNFFIQNSLKKEDVYTLILPRTLESLYKNIASTTYTIPELDTNKTESISKLDSDAFWALSTYECSSLWDSDSSRVGYTPNSSNASYWSLRSSEYTQSVKFVFNTGIYSNACGVQTSTCGVRPAFLI